MAATIDLRGQTAVVTGASRGIGLATAEALAASGARIIAISRAASDSAALSTLADMAGVEVTCLDGDLSQRSEVRRVLRAIEEDVGPVDIVVHAAGMNLRAPAVDFADDAWDQVLAVNLDAPFFLTRRLGRHMLERGSGKVIFLASVLSFQGGITAPAYAASKGGVVQLTKAFANEWASAGVNVNAVAPGYVVTDMTEALLTDVVRLRQISDRIPAGRWATPPEIAQAILFLASSLSDYVHGTVLSVDGGWMAR